MIFQATLSNKAHPEYGMVTVPFPIPKDEYDHTIEILESLGVGGVNVQDCQMDSFSGKYPVLNCLSGQSVKVDELDYLAKRLDSFCAGEDDQFQAMASKLELSDIKDFISLTFCCQEVTVITDFSDLEKIGKDHSLIINRKMCVFAGDHQEIDLCKVIPIPVIAPSDKVDHFAVRGHAGNIQGKVTAVMVHIGPPAEKILLF